MLICLSWGWRDHAGYPLWQKAAHSTIPLGPLQAPSLSLVITGDSLPAPWYGLLVPGCSCHAEWTGSPALTASGQLMMQKQVSTLAPHHSRCWAFRLKTNEGA